MCNWAFSFATKNPVHSNTTSISNSFQGKFLGSASEKTLTSFPSIEKHPSLTITSFSKRPWVESYLSKCANIFASVKSLIATTSTPSNSCINLNANLPILPNPLIATFISIPPYNFIKAFAYNIAKICFAVSLSVIRVISFLILQIEIIALYFSPYPAIAITSLIFKYCSISNPIVFEL